MWFINILILIFMLGTLVTLHELGHFLVAKKCGVHIYEFSIGMGPLIHSHIGKDKIQYSIRALPIGGYVQMAGEVDEDDEKIKKEKFMCNKPWYQRILILIAGVTMNFITAFVLLFFIALVWGANSSEPRLTQVIESSAMEAAGAKVNDVILAVDGKETKTWDRAQILLTLDNKKEYYEIKVRHEDQTEETLKVTPKKSTNDKGEETKSFGIQVVPTKSYGFIPALKYACIKFVSLYESMFRVIIGLFTNQLSINSLSGPVGMYSIVDESVKYGLEQILYLTAYISINLGFINLLPFPAFDGGHILFVIIEKIKGSRVNQKLENGFHTVGFILLMILMIYITCKDVIQLF